MSVSIEINEQEHFSFFLVLFSKDSFIEDKKKKLIALENVVYH